MAVFGDEIEVSPNYTHEHVTFVSALSDLLDKFLQDMLSRNGMSSTDVFIKKLDDIKQSFSAVISFNEMNIESYIRPFREDNELRDLLFTVWVGLNTVVGGNLIHEISRRMLEAVPFLTNQIGNQPVKSSPFFIKEFIDDLPKSNDLAPIYSAHRWLFIPAMIAMFYDLNAAERRLAAWGRENGFLAAEKAEKKS